MMNNEAAVIKTDKLTKSFNGKIAVDKLDVEVSRGEIFGLVGPDGAGKSTSLRMMTTVLDPTSGDAWIFGKNVAKAADEIKGVMGYMSQKFGLYPDLSVLQNIQFYADLYQIPRKQSAERMEQLLNITKLSPFKNRRAEHLSGGMKQKLGLICTLIHNPKVLFLDEPNNGIDPLSRRDFWRILYELLQEKVTIFLTTPYLDEAERCNRVGLMHEGKLLACGRPEELKSQYGHHLVNPSLEDVFLSILTDQMARPQNV